MSTFRRGPQIVLGLLLAVTVTIPMLSGGGFNASSRSTFVILAGLLLLTAGVVDPTSVSRAARSPLALTLIALAVVSAASTIWTIGNRSDALRWGLVIAGYGAVAIASATLAEETGPWPIAGGIAGLATLEAIIGLIAVAFHSLPDAERIVRAWEPGGTFQYPPALAILQVGALPILTIALDRRGDVIAGAAAGALVLAGAVLRLADSRLSVALAAVVLLALILRPSEDRRPLQSAVATGFLVLTGGLLATPIFGGNVGPRAGGAGAAGLVAIAIVATLACLAWPIARHTRLLAGTPSGRSRRALAAVLAAAVALSVVYLTSAPAQPHAQVRTVAAHTGRPPSDPLHGRSKEWLAAIDTWLDRPLLGAGTGAYYVASLRHQTVARSLYAHSLPLELAAELGAFGLLLGVLIYASAAWTVFRALYTPSLWLFGPLVIVFLVSNLLDWTWHLAGLGAIWAAASGALIGATESSSAPTSSGRSPTAARSS